MSRRCVLHVIAPAPYGGAEAVVHALATGALRRGEYARVVLLLQLAGEHPLAARLRADAVPVHEIRCGRRRYRAEAAALAELVRQLTPYVVHTHGYHADLVGYRATRICRVPLIATAHGFIAGNLKNRVYQWLDIRAMRRFDAVISVAEVVRLEVLKGGVDPDLVSLVPNASIDVPPLPRAEARRLLGLPDDVTALGWVGRISDEKGPDLFVEAFRRLAGPGVAAALVGDGPARDRLEAMIATGGMADHVWLAGAREDAARLLSAFDALVISSRSEGLPMVLFEAIMAGVPVISFLVGGIPTVVSDASAYLVPAGDVEGLANAMKRVIEQPVEAREKAAEAVRVVQARFGMESWLNQHVAVYEKAQRHHQREGRR